MKYIIKAPNKNYNGTSATVSFRDGTGNTDSEHLAEWFRKHGYDVIESEREPAPLKFEDLFDMSEDEPENMPDTPEEIQEQFKTAEPTVLNLSGASEGTQEEMQEIIPESELEEAPEEIPETIPEPEPENIPEETKEKQKKTRTKKKEAENPKEE